MESTLPTLLKRLTDPSISDSRVISWSSPVPAFGDVTRSRVATLGLNPSNREFVDTAGKELSGDNRRFHTLSSLGIPCWSQAESAHCDQIVESCRAYFTRNPYDSWFRQLDHIIAGTDSSYYDEASQACHLDLIPYATACKWTDLSRIQKERLLAVVGDTLGQILRDSPIRLLVLNGRSVVEQFQDMAGLELKRREMAGWTLKRHGRPVVTGYSYVGTVHSLAGIEFGRAIQILGFNHNLQSSFGVTKEVRGSIRRWIARASKEAAA